MNPQLSDFEMHDDKDAETRVAPLKAGADGQDLPRSDDCGNAEDAERTEWAGYPLTWGDEG